MSGRGKREPKPKPKPKPDPRLKDTANDGKTRALEGEGAKKKVAKRSKRTKKDVENDKLGKMGSAVTSKAESSATATSNFTLDYNIVTNPNANNTSTDFIQHFFLKTNQEGAKTEYRKIENYAMTKSKDGPVRIRPTRKITIPYTPPGDGPDDTLNNFRSNMGHVADFFERSGILEVKSVLSYKKNGSESEVNEGTPPKVVFRLVLIKIILLDALKLKKTKDQSFVFEIGQNNNNFGSVEGVIVKINEYFASNSYKTYQHDILLSLYSDTREEGVSSDHAMPHLLAYKNLFFPSGDIEVNEMGYENEIKYFQELFLRIIQSKGLSDSLQNQEGIDYTLKKYNSLLATNEWIFGGETTPENSEITPNDAMRLRFNTVVTAISSAYNNDNNQQQSSWENFCNIVTLPRYMFVSQDKIAAAVQTCMFTQCRIDHFNIPFEIVCPIKNNSGFFSNFIQHKNVMSMGILLQMACVNVTPHMIKNDQQYIDMLSPNERTIVFTTHFFLSDLSEVNKAGVVRLIMNVRTKIQEIINRVYAEDFQQDNVPYLNKYITQLFQTPQISTYAVLVHEINLLITDILAGAQGLGGFGMFVGALQLFYYKMQQLSVRQACNNTILRFVGKVAGDVTGSFPVNIMYYFLIQDCIKIRCAEKGPRNEIKRILDSGSGITVASLIDSLYGHDFHHNVKQDYGRPIMDVRKMNESYFNNIFPPLGGENDPYRTLRQMKSLSNEIDGISDSKREDYAIAKVMELNKFGCLHESERTSEKNPYLHYYLDGAPIAKKTEAEGDTGAANVLIYPSTKATLTVHPILNYAKTRVMKRLLSANSEVEDEVVHDGYSLPIEIQEGEGAKEIDQIKCLEGEQLNSAILNVRELIREEVYKINNSPLPPEKEAADALISLGQEATATATTTTTEKEGEKEEKEAAAEVGMDMAEESIDPVQEQDITVDETFERITDLFYLAQYILEQAPVTSDGETSLNKRSRKLIDEYIEITKYYDTYKHGRIDSMQLDFDPRDVFDDEFNSHFVVSNPSDVNDNVSLAGNVDNQAQREEVRTDMSVDEGVNPSFDAQALGDVTEGKEGIGGMVGDDNPQLEAQETMDVTESLDENLDEEVTGDVTVIAGILIIARSKTLSIDILDILDDIEEETSNEIKGIYSKLDNEGEEEGEGEEGTAGMELVGGSTLAKDMGSSDEYGSGQEKEGEDEEEEDQTQTSTGVEGEGENLKRDRNKANIGSPARRSDIKRQNSNQGSGEEGDEGIPVVPSTPTNTNLTSTEKQEYNRLNAKLLEVNNQVRKVFSKVILAIDFTNTSRQDFQHLQMDSYRHFSYAVTEFSNVTDLMEDENTYYRIANFYQENTDGIQVYGAAARFDGAAPYKLSSDVFYADQCKEAEDKEYQDDIFKVVVKDTRSCSVSEENKPTTRIETDYDLLPTSQSTASPTNNLIIDKFYYTSGVILQPFTKSNAFGIPSIMENIKGIFRGMRSQLKLPKTNPNSSKPQINRDKLQQLATQNEMIGQIYTTLTGNDNGDPVIEGFVQNSSLTNMIVALIKINENTDLKVLDTKKKQPSVIETLGEYGINEIEDPEYKSSMVSTNNMSSISSPHTERRRGKRTGVSSDVQEDSQASSGIFTGKKASAIGDDLVNAPDSESQSRYIGDVAGSPVTGTSNSNSSKNPPPSAEKVDQSTGKILTSSGSVGDFSGFGARSIDPRNLTSTVGSPGAVVNTGEEYSNPGYPGWEDSNSGVGGSKTHSQKKKTSRKKRKEKTNRKRRFSRNKSMKLKTKTSRKKRGKKPEKSKNKHSRKAKI